MSEDDHRGGTTGEGGAYDIPVSSLSAGRPSTAALQGREIPDCPDGHDDALREIERMTMEANFEHGPGPNMNFDLQASQAIRTGSPATSTDIIESLEGLIPTHPLLNDSRASTEETEEKADRAKGRSAGPQTSIDRFLEWQRYNNRPSITPFQHASAAEMIRNYQTYLREKVWAEAVPSDADPHKPDLSRRLLTLPVEIQLLIFENLNASDFVKLKLCSKTLYKLIDILAPSNLATRPQIRSFKDHLAGFNYKDVSLVEALRHWNLNKGIALRDLEFNSQVFAKFYVWQNKDADANTVGLEAGNGLGHCSELAAMFTGLHLATYEPNADTIDSELYDLLSDPEFYELEIQKLSQQNFSKEVMNIHEMAIKTIKKDQAYFGSKIWSEDLSGGWNENADPTSNANVLYVSQASARLGKLKPLTPVHTGRNTLKDPDNDLNVLPRGLGIPQLPFPFQGDQAFAYCWTGGITQSQFDVPLHDIKMLNYNGFEDDDPDALLKVAIIEHLTIY